MKKRAVAYILALVFALAAVPALALSSINSQRVVYDDASVLSESLEADIKALNEKAEDMDVRFAVVTRHFLGGADAQAYCDRLHSEYPDNGDLVLLLLVIGEERYAVTAGEQVLKAVSLEQVNTLLSGKLRSTYLEERDYDGAVGQFFLAMAEQVARAKNVTLRTSGLFGTEKQAAADEEKNTIFDNWNGQWWSGFFAENVDESSYSENSTTEYEYYYEEDDEGFSVGKMIFIVIVLMWIVRRRAKNGKSGLGLMGWMVAKRGIDEAMKARNTNRRYTRPRR